MCFSFVETDFFQKKKIQKFLSDILVVIAKRNPERSYLQVFTFIKIFNY